MSRSAICRLEVWDGAERAFALRIGELERLQEACDAGPVQILRRLGDGAWRTQDVRETIRLGLIGGGAKQEEALALIKRHVDPPHLQESVPLARMILTASLVGVEDERPGKSEPATTTSPLSPEGNGASPASTPSEP